MFAIAGGIILAVFILANLESIIEGIAVFIVAMIKIAAIVGAIFFGFWLMHLVLPDQVLIGIMAFTVVGGMFGYLTFLIARAIYRTTVARHAKKVTVLLARSTVRPQHPEQPPSYSA